MVQDILRKYELIHILYKKGRALDYEEQLV